MRDVLLCEIDSCGCKNHASAKTKAPKTTKKKKPAKKSKKEVAEEEKRQREKHLLDLISQRDQATQARVDKLSADKMILHCWTHAVR